MSSAMAGGVLRIARTPAAVTLLVTLSPTTVGSGARRHKKRGSRPGRRVLERRTLVGRLPLRGRARRGRADTDCQGRTNEPPSPRLRANCQGVCCRGPSLRGLARQRTGRRELSEGHSCWSRSSSSRGANCQEGARAGPEALVRSLVDPEGIRGLRERSALRELRKPSCRLSRSCDVRAAARMGVGTEKSVS
jgi:hypothetical protein